MRKLFVLVASVALISAGCGGSSKTPTAPSSSQGSSSTGSPSSPVPPASATISGTVQSGGAAASGMTIGVVNTALSTRSDNSGRFTLGNVPAGNVSLRISGPGADAIAAVGTVQPSQTVEIVVTVSGSTAKVEGPGRNENENEVEGAIESIQSGGNFRVAGRSVHTDSSTIIRNGSQTVAFSTLKVGTRVEVHGALSGDTLNATRVEVLPADDDDGAPNQGNPGPNPGPNNPGPNAETELKGVVSSLSGTASSFTFKIGSTTVKGDSSTRFDNSGEGLTTSDDGRSSNGFSSLKNGVTVEVKGTLSGTTVQASRIHVEDDNEDDDDEDDDANEAELTGTLGSITNLGSGCPTIRSTVGGTTFTTSASTTFLTSCSSLRSGDRVEIKGTRQSNGSVAATRVKRED